MLFNEKLQSTIDAARQKQQEFLDKLNSYPSLAKKDSIADSVPSAEQSLIDQIDKMNEPIVRANTERTNREKRMLLLTAIGTCAAVIAAIAGVIVLILSL
jgi:hypothetical protein